MPSSTTATELNSLRRDWRDNFSRWPNQLDLFAELLSRVTSTIFISKDSSVFKFQFCANC